MPPPFPELVLLLIVLFRIVSRPGVKGAGGLATTVPVKEMPPPPPVLEPVVELPEMVLFSIRNVPPTEKQIAPPLSLAVLLEIVELRIVRKLLSAPLRKIAPPSNDAELPEMVLFSIRIVPKTA